MAMSVSGVLNAYTYSYGSTTRAKLDKNDDSKWTRDELREYADAYNSATGKTLDVDALMDKYGETFTKDDGSTVVAISAAKQEEMLKADELGFSVLKSLNNSSGSGSAETKVELEDSGPSSMTIWDRKNAAIDAVNAFTFSYGGKLQPLLDKNNDGLWGRDEIELYAQAFSRATGKKLNVDEIMKKYGSEVEVEALNGSKSTTFAIDPTQQAKMKKDDALHLGDLLKAYEATVSISDQPLFNEAESTLPKNGRYSANYNYSLEDSLANMSASAKMSYALSVNKYQGMGNLLGMMTGISYNTGTNILDMQSMFNSLNSLQAAKMQYGSGSGSVYNSLKSSLNKEA